MCFFFRVWSSEKNADSHASNLQKKKVRKAPNKFFDVAPADAVRAKWSFESGRVRELSLEKNELVLVLRRKEDW